MQVEFLPPNTTTALQPYDAGIIYSFKCHYKRFFIKNRIDAYDDLQNSIVQELADYNIYDALLNAAEAWSMVSPETITNCWRKTNILSQKVSFPIPVPDPNKYVNILLFIINKKKYMYI